MLFVPYVVLAKTGDPVPVSVQPTSQADLLSTKPPSLWQSDWTSEYLSDPRVEKFAVKTKNGDLVALAAYQIRGRSAYVYILYVESAPHSNPTICGEKRRYYGIGELLIAFGIKYSIDHGCRGDVVFDAKTDELARHYEMDFHAKRVSGPTTGGPKRYMLADEDAWRLFSKFLKEEEP